ncbi:hypothetical protein ACSBM8_08350 [Sphingomonas sp. ASY06-1R]|uniref:hypothetical protein n=1 Tax=Sphingomonas sp. ASY06-1R TaxID=3445771 RepID=UPI003FA1C1D9
MFAVWLLAQAASAAAAPAVAPTALQGQFEQATAALEAEKWEEAATAFRGIANRPHASARTRGIATMRMGSALLNLGREEEAERALREGVQMVGTADPALNDDRIVAYLALGGMEKRNFDYVAARRDFGAVLALAGDSMAKIRALVALISVTMFNDNAAALGYANDMMAIAGTAKVSPTVDATLYDMRGRVLLNRGDYKGALADLDVALKDLGGLTTHTDLNDVMVRADLALANFLAGNPSKAREYFEMTGEGRLPGGPFALGASTDLPVCGGDLRPEDRAVVEFGIGTDGNVSYANPVYASRSGPLAHKLAEAVSGWSWKAGDVAKIPPFYRLATRVELRCSNAVQRPADIDLLIPQVTTWLGGPNRFNLAVPATPAQLAKLRSDVLAADAEGDKRTLIGALAMIAAAPTTDRSESRDRYARAASLAAEVNAPPAVMAYLTLSSSRASGGPEPGGRNRYLATVRKMLTQPQIEADAETAGVLRLILGSPIQRVGYAPDAEALLRKVADDTRLDARSPIRVGALVRLSSLQAQHEQLDAARASFARTGLDAKQCSLVDAQPVAQKLGFGNQQYPMEMLRMGVSGWTQIELDVLPNGETTNRRAVISYPPLMFGEGTVKAMAKTRYTQSYRPDGGLGCGGAIMRIRYVIPKT